LNQQQLQIARAALWHQTANPPPAAPLLTFDDASAWLDEIGLCLLLPRHTQLPAPAPSFVEACMGVVRAMPPADAIAQATELASRLIQADLAVPLNLLGTVSEQPDFLVTPDVLPWVAAVRGDRQWKTAPPGRIAPIVLRTWEALDKEGDKTAIEISEILGRELTEAAVLRALIELWTTLRAVPAYTPGQPTRWSLLKNRYPAQLATGANTAQTTALSALLSIYVRAAVAASAEEAEIFLSPLTARSRIREVIHGMTAARQFRTMSVGTQTLLFLEGSLPESAPEPEPEKQPAKPQPIALAPSLPSRKEPRPTKWELPGARPQTPQPRREFVKRPAANFGQRRDSGPRRAWQPGARKPPARFAPESGEKRPREQRPAAADRKPYPDRGKPHSDRPYSDRGQRAGKPAFSAKPGQRPARATARPSAKPWPRRPGQNLRSGDFPKRPRAARPERPAVANRPPRENRPPTKPRWRNKESAPPQSRQNRPWRGQPPQGSDNRPPRPDHPQPINRPQSMDRSQPIDRPRRDARPRNDRPRNESRPRSDSRPRTGPPRPAKKFPANPRFSGPKGSSPARSGPPSPRSATTSRPSQSGKFPARRSSRPPARPGARFSRPGTPFKKSFRKSDPGKQIPRKNRSQEENPE
jgi:hypothetical protein